MSWTGYARKTNFKAQDGRKSGCKMAELNVSGTVTMDHEIQLYKKAVRQLYRELGLDSFTDITLHKRQGKLIAVRGRK